MYHTYIQRNDITSVHGTSQLITEVINDEAIKKRKSYQQRLSVDFIVTFL